MTPNTTRKLARWLLITALFLSATAAAWWLYRRWSDPLVLTTPVVRGPAVQAFYATGTLQPHREYPVKSNVEGILTELLVDKGAAVTQGQKLAFVRVESYQMAFSKALAEYEHKKSLLEEGRSPLLLEFDAKLKAANERLAIAQRELDRATELRKVGSASQTDFDRADERLQNVWSETESIKAQKATKKLELEKDLAVAKAALDVAKWNLDEQIIESPIDGAVLDWPVSTGTRVKINDLLMVVADVTPQKLIMRAAVDEEDKTRLHVEQLVKITLYAYPARVFDGRVKQVYPQADPNRGTFEADVAIVHPDPEFAAGMTGELAFIVHAKDDALIIPSQAYQNNAVWTVQESALKKTPATIGLRGIEWTEITSGLNQGDPVVVSPIQNLQEGARVRVQTVEPAQAAQWNKPQTQQGNFKGFH